MKLIGEPPDGVADTDFSGGGREKERQHHGLIIRYRHFSIYLRQDDKICPRPRTDHRGKGVVFSTNYSAARTSGGGNTISTSVPSFLRLLIVKDA